MDFILTAGRSIRATMPNGRQPISILMNRSIEAAVLENGGDSILCEGLAYDGCQVGVITNVDLPGILAATISKHRNRFSMYCAPRWMWCCRRARRSSMPMNRCLWRWRRCAMAKSFTSAPTPELARHQRSIVSRHDAGTGSARGNRAVIVRGEGNSALSTVLMKCLGQTG